MARGLFVLALLLPLAVCVEEVPIRIVRAKAKSTYTAPAPVEPIASRPARPFAGPEAYRTLQGRCWTITSNGYEYKLCPFHNVTQKAVGRSHTIFHGILG